VQAVESPLWLGLTGTSGGARPFALHLVPAHEFLPLHVDCLGGCTRSDVPWQSDLQVRPRSGLFGKVTGELSDVVVPIIRHDTASKLTPLLIEE
jgi:hypothetical protein